MAVTRVEHPSVEERRELGKRLKKATPPASHAKWKPAGDRPDPVALLEDQNTTREHDLVPVRDGRMMVSPFAFYRGTAKIMAADLKDTPTAGLTVQLCGDAHLSNFGLFASPERHLLFDLNDFDETLPGPFEYDVKRLAASFSIAARNNGFSKSQARESTLAAVNAYSASMAQFAQMGVMEIWYARMAEENLMAAAGRLEEAQRKRLAKQGTKPQPTGNVAKILQRAHTRDSMQALSKLAEFQDGQYRIVSHPPVVVPARELHAAYGLSPEELQQTIHRQFRAYRATLQYDRRHVLERFQIVDMARKVVGVGTGAYIVLLQGRDANDPLFLQVKQATASVLEDHLPKSRFAQPGERVVQGQRMMQAASDIYLGWTKRAREGRWLYWRQLRDMKGAAEIELMKPMGLTFYAELCGWTLARAHARSGDPVALAAYLGKGGAFAEAIADFSGRYADQNERDHEAFIDAVRSGRLEALEGV